MDITYKEQNIFVDSTFIGCISVDSVPSEYLGSTVMYTSAYLEGLSMEVVPRDTNSRIFLLKFGVVIIIIIIIKSIVPSSSIGCL